jgi:hypothetical protein
MFEAYQGLGETLTAHATNMNLTFPFVSLPMFEVAGRHTLAQSRNELLFFAPFVAGDRKEEWEQYAVEHQGWLDEGRKIRLEADQTLQVSSFIEGPIPTRIFEFLTAAGDLDLSPQGRDYYSPIWQTSPVPFTSSLQNFNVRSFENTEFVMDTMRLLKGTLLQTT